MKKFFILLVFANLSLITAFADERVVVDLKNGNALSFDFTKKPVLTISNELKVSSLKGNTISMPYSDVRKVYWGNNSATKIDGIQNNNSNSNVAFKISDDGIYISGLADGERVDVFTTSGVKVSTGVMNRANEIYRLYLPRSSSQVYVIRTSRGISFKFINN